MNCQECSKPVPPSRGTRARKWCSDSCRVAHRRKVPVPQRARPPVVAPDDLTPGEAGTVAAVRALVASLDLDDEVAAAQAALALDMARMVELGSSPAAGQLRQLLFELGAARAPGSDGVVTQALYAEAIAAVYGEVGEGTLDRPTPPGWIDTDTSGEVLHWLGRRWFELRDDGRVVELLDLEKWVGAHTGEIHQLRRSGRWSVWPDDRDSL